MTQQINDNVEAATPQQAQQETAQQRFNKMYISSAEICRDLGVTRPSVMNARKRGQLPDPIFVDEHAICIWEREPLQPFLRAWRIILDAKRTGAAQA